MNIVGSKKMSSGGGRIKKSKEYYREKYYRELKEQELKEGVKK